MKTLITTTFLSLLIQFAIGQKNFEGKIIYSSTIPGLDTSFTKIYFGTQKIKIVEITRPTGKLPIETRITDFAKGITHLIDDSSRTYFEMFLKKDIPDSITELKPCPEKNKKILGYNCSAYRIASDLDTIKSDWMPQLDIYMWYADSLFYIIDKKYKNANSIEKATNGSNVGMGMEINIGKDSSLQRISATAVSVTTETMPDSLFLVPNDYALKTEQNFNGAVLPGQLQVLDIQMAEVRQDDSTPPPPPPPPPLLPKQKHKKKKATKKS